AARKAVSAVSRSSARKKRLRFAHRIVCPDAPCRRGSWAFAHRRSPRSSGLFAAIKHLAADAETSITFCEMLTGNLKWGALSAADAFVLPSHQENFGIAVVEALACATPVLISNKVNIWREIVNDGSGFADEDDLAGTTRLIERWIRALPEVRDAMRGNARQCFARRFEINRAV